MPADFDALTSRLSERLQGGVQQGAPLARLTTYRLGGPAGVLVGPVDLADLEELGRVLASETVPVPVPVLALGRGSNTVVSDEGWPGVVVRLGESWSRITTRPENDVVFEAGSAKALPLVANWAARRRLSGLEWSVGVPGSVGGAVRMNAGAHGSDMASCVVSARVFDLDALRATTWDATRLGFSYRHSELDERHIVLSATLRLTTADTEAVRARMDSYRRHRVATQPGALQNAGSTFKNPPGDSAGRLVDAAGLKGFRMGGASVSDKHANFFMASPQARAQDVFDLVYEVRRRVFEAFSVWLEPEVRFAGAFATDRVEVGDA